MFLHEDIPDREYFESQQRYFSFNFSGKKFLKKDVTQSFP